MRHFALFALVSSAPMSLQARPQCSEQISQEMTNCPLLTEHYLCPEDPTRTCSVSVADCPIPKPPEPEKPEAPKPEDPETPEPDQPDQPESPEPEPAPEPEDAPESPKTPEAPDAPEAPPEAPEAPEAPPESPGTDPDEFDNPGDYKVVLERREPNGRWTPVTTGRADCSDPHVRCSASMDASAVKSPLLLEVKVPAGSVNCVHARCVVSQMPLKTQSALQILRDKVRQNKGTCEDASVNCVQPEIPKQTVRDECGRVIFTPPPAWFGPSVAETLKGSNVDELIIKLKTPLLNPNSQKIPIFSPLKPKKPSPFGSSQPGIRPF